MINSYEINKETLAIVPIGLDKSMVYEYEKEFIVNKSSMEIIDFSCKFFGSSYTGRFEGTKYLVGYNYKAPIIIEETTQIIFFPTASPREATCAWISLRNIKSHIKIGNQTMIMFKNNKEILLDISVNSFENQILRSTKLWSIILEKNNLLKLS